MKRLTKKRANIFMEFFIPLLESNMNESEGDLYEAYQKHTYNELQDSIDAIYNTCYRLTNKKKSKNHEA